MPARPLPSSQGHLRLPGASLAARLKTPLKRPRPRASGRLCRRSRNGWSGRGTEEAEPSSAPDCRGRRRPPPVGLAMTVRLTVPGPAGPRQRAARAPGACVPIGLFHFRTEILLHSRSRSPCLGAPRPAFPSHHKQDMRAQADDIEDSDAEWTPRKQGEGPGGLRGAALRLTWGRSELRIRVRKQHLLVLQTRSRPGNSLLCRRGLVYLFFLFFFLFFF